MKSTLDAMAEKVAAGAALTSQLDMERIAMTQTSTAIRMAENGMRRFPQDDKLRTRQTHDKLLDQSTLHRLEETAETNRDNYLDLAQRALEKTVAAQDGKPTALQVELEQYLDSRPATAKPLAAPATARFTRKPQVKPLRCWSATSTAAARSRTATAPGRCCLTTCAACCKALC